MKYFTVIFIHFLSIIIFKFLLFLRYQVFFFLNIFVHENKLTCTHIHAHNHAAQGLWCRLVGVGSGLEDHPGLDSH